MKSAASPPDQTYSVEVVWQWLLDEYGERRLPPVISTVGLGDGSLLEALDTKAPGTRVLAAEPDRVAASYLASNPRVAAWLRAGRLILLVGPDYLAADQAWRIFPTNIESSPVLVHPASTHASGLAKAVSVLKKVVFGAVANANARRKFAPRYLLNSLRNLPSIVSGRDIMALSGMAPSVPAVVIGAGPSLDNLHEQVEDLADRAIVIATDTALRPLLAQGIEPHLVVGLDPSETNARHLLGLPACDRTWLVAESALDPRAVAPFAGRTFWFRVAPHHPWPWLNELGVDVGRLDVWGSVLTAAFQVAVLAGCDPIVLAGADLSFPGGRPYARGTTYEFDWAWEAALGKPVEHTWRAGMAARSDLRAETDLAAQRVLTTGAMLQFRDWLVSQAQKSGRRVVNAGGSGMLFGNGVDVATFSTVIPSAVLRPDLSTVVRPTTVRPKADLARILRTVRAQQVSGQTDTWPLSGWKEFSGEGFDATRVGEVLSDAARHLESAHPPTSTRQWRSVRPAPATLLSAHSLPEAVSSLRIALIGEPVAHNPSLSIEERVQRLLNALPLLGLLVAGSRAGQDFVSLPDPTLIDTTAIGAIGMWPEELRWDVLRFEAQLGAVWGATVPPPERSVVGSGEVLRRDATGGAPNTTIAAWPHATHCCVLLATEWLRCAASLRESEGSQLQAAIDRLWTLERWLRGTPESARTGAEAELTIEAWIPERPAESQPVTIPLGVSEAALARVLTGAVASPHGDWLIGGFRGPLAIRVAVKVSGPSSERSQRQEDDSLRLVPTPRSVGLPGNLKLKLTDSTPAGALCVADFSTKTVLVGADGKITVCQEWPRPITGALSHRDFGDIAWCNAMVASPPYPTPYLMHRPAPNADVSMVELPFRPALGVYWQGRVYFTCLPTATAAGGIGSWAPGEEPRHEHSGLTLLSILPENGALFLEPYLRESTEGVPRKRVRHGWSWSPGQQPVKRRLEGLGSTAAIAVTSGWTARAFPQADVIRFEALDGRRVVMRCYSPLRMAWCEASLLVFNGDRHLLLFENILRVLA